MEFKLCISVITVLVRCCFSSTIG